MKPSKTKLPNNIWYIPTTKKWPCDNEQYIVYRISMGTAGLADKDTRYGYHCYIMKFKMV